MITEIRRNGIQWTLYNHLDDLDFADGDLSLPSHSHNQIGETRASKQSVNADRTQHQQNIKIMKANTKSNNTVTLGREPLEETDSFTCLGSEISNL